VHRARVCVRVGRAVVCVVRVRYPPPFSDQAHTVSIPPLTHASCPFPPHPGFSKGKSTYIGKQYKANLGDLSRTLIGRTLMVSQLVDMEWKFAGEAFFVVFRHGRVFSCLTLFHRRLSTLLFSQLALCPPLSDAFVNLFDSSLCLWFALSSRRHLCTLLFSRLSRLCLWSGFKLSPFPSLSYTGRSFTSLPLLESRRVLTFHRLVDLLCFRLVCVTWAL